MSDTASGRARSRSREIDLRGVAPLRRAETRRRIEAIRSYLSIVFPTDADRADAANSLGIGVQQFMSMVRAWTTHGEAVAIARSGASAGSARGVRRHGLPPESREAAENALRALPASASHKDAIAAVQAACRGRGTRAPSDSMISYLRMELRRSSCTADRADGLLVGRATATLPIRTNEGLSLPEVALAVDRRSGTIIAAAIVDSMTGCPPPTFAAAVRMAAEGTDGTAIVGADDAAVAGSLSKARLVSRFMAGRLLSKAIGRWLGAVRLTYGPLASTDPNRALRTKADQPLDLAEAATVIEVGVAAHNASLAGGTIDQEAHPRP